MSVRKITVISTTRTTPKELYSEATTWGQLQESLSEFGNVASMRAVVKETKNDLTSSQAELPSGDFTLFLTPKTIKAGTDLVAVLEALKDKWVNAIDEVIDEIEEGEYAGSGNGSKSVTNEDQAILAKLLRGEL